MGRRARVSSPLFNVSSFCCFPCRCFPRKARHSKNKARVLACATQESLQGGEESTAPEVTGHTTIDRAQAARTTQQTGKQHMSSLTAESRGHPAHRYAYGMCLTASSTPTGVGRITARLRVTAGGSRRRRPWGADQHAVHNAHLSMGCTRIAKGAWHHTGGCVERHVIAACCSIGRTVVLASVDCRPLRPGRAAAARSQ